MQDEKENKAEEPAEEYGSLKKTIRFFKSFEEENEYRYKMLAALSYEQRLDTLSRHRRRTFSKILLPDNTFPSFKKIIAVTKLTYEF